MVPNGKRNEEEARRRESAHVLRGVEDTSGTFMRSALSNAASRASDHFAARDAVGAEADGSTDRIELWGRRIGRALSLAGVIALACYLYLTYLR